MTKTLICLTSFVLILVFPIHQIVLANSAFEIPFSGTIKNSSTIDHNPSLLIAGVDHTLIAKELLKVKGTGWASNFAKGVGQFVSQIGGKLIQYGAKLIDKANNFFAKLKEGGFAAVKDMIKNGVANFFKRQVAAGRAYSSSKLAYCSLLLPHFPLTI